MKTKILSYTRDVVETTQSKSKSNRAIMNRLCHWCCPLVSHSEYTPRWHHLCLADYGQTWRHPQNWKYIMYWLLSEKIQAVATVNTQKILWRFYVWFLRHASKQTQRDTETHSLQYFAPQPERSKKYGLNYMVRFRYYITGEWWQPLTQPGIELVQACTR